MPVTTTSSPSSPTELISPVSSGESASVAMSALHDLAGGGVHADSLAGRLVRRDRFGDRGRGGAADAGHHSDLLDGRRAELLQGSEVLDQGLAADLAQAGDVVEQALDHG